MGSSGDEVASMLDCDTVESEFEFRLGIYVHFQTNTLVLVLTYLSLLIWINYCISARVPLALNNTKRFCHILTLDRTVNQEMHLCK